MGSSTPPALLPQAVPVHAGHSATQQRGFFSNPIILRIRSGFCGLQKHVSDRPNPSFNSDPTGTGYRNVSWN